MRTLIGAAEPDEPGRRPVAYRFEPIVPGGPATFTSMDPIVEWLGPSPPTTTVQTSVVLIDTTQLTKEHPPPMGELTHGKLGLRPADLSRPVLRFAEMRTGAVPAHPLAADHFTGVSWGMYRNDAFSDCGPTMIANIRRAITKILGGAQQDPTQDDVWDLYRRSGNPNFDPATGEDDNGVVMAEMLSALLHGGIGGVKPLAYAAVNVKNLEEVRAAISIFGALAMGSDLDVAQQQQTRTGLWDYKRSGLWGGHATPALGYTSATRGRDFSLVSWGQLIGATDAFWAHQVQECFVVIWPEHVGSRQFQEGVDGAAANAAYTALTGRPGPFPTTPPAPAGDQQVADGQFAYATYGKAVAGLAHNGRRMPVWDDLGAKVQGGWIAVGNAFRAR